MAGDFSRKTFNQKKHYSGVLMQQGRVQVDADWNEQLDIQHHRTRTETKDVIGASGVPKKGNSFKITAAAMGADLLIAPGHMYVGGLLCELDKALGAASYLNQPYYPNPDKGYFMDAPASPPDSPPQSPPAPPPLKLRDGTYLVYVDAWQREINYLDEPLIREVALGEADTAARLQNVWQVKLFQAGNAATTCQSDPEEWLQLIAPSTGHLNVRTTAGDSPKPCALPPSAGYQSLENQLYRVEVQQGGSRATATFKWSRDNASVETKIEKIIENILTVADTGKDEVLGFAPGQWVEVVDEESTLKSSPQHLIQVLSVETSRGEITLSTADIPNKGKDKLKLRRWDQSPAAAGAGGLPAITEWIGLEAGIQVSFSEGTYRAGDYWLIPARTATGEVEWPPYEIPNPNPVQQPPLGIHHYYCKLALLQVQAGIITVLDCRPLFPALTEICAEDICFDNQNCHFPQADNVQEALDILCAANDLRSHNKYLHGFGVICGLKVKCGFARTGVIVEQGHALDCEGNMVQIKKRNGQVYELVQEAQNLNLLDKGGSGTVCLSIAGGPNRTAAFSVERYVPQNFWDTVLEGTLLQNFYEECILNLIDFFREQFPFPLTDVAPVPVSQRRLTALLNLFAQLINSASGPYGFISGTKGRKQGEKINEDQLLRDFYNDLREKVASETFCAMFDQDRPFPEYAIDPGLGTIFGPALKVHHRLRLHPSGRVAYTCGENNKIYVYNLVTNELIHSIDFPGAPNIIVKDIAVSQEGDELYAVAILNDKDSFFAIASIDPAGRFTWGITSLAPGIKFISLVLGPSNRLYGIGQALGFFAVTGIGSSAFSSANVKEFNATGLLTISDQGQVVAAVQSTNAAVTAFSELIIFSLLPAANDGRVQLST